MALSLPPFKEFDMNSDPMSLGPKWTSWIDEFYNLMLALEVTEKKRMKALKIEGCPIKIQVDTGASVNVLDELDLPKIRSKVKIEHTDKRIFPYGSKTPLPLVGKFQATVETKSKFDIVTFYIAKSTSNFMGSLLGLKSAITLGLISFVKSLDHGTDQGNIKLKNVLKEFTPSVLCNKVGKMKDVTVSLSIDTSVTPVALKHRRIPFHLRKKVEKEIERLLDADIIETIIDEPTEWVSPVVIGNKPNGDIRICVDMTEPNKAIKRVHHVIPTIEEIKYKVNGAWYFSKIDLNKGYHQLELDPASRNVTTFSTHLGIARYKRLNFGCKSATEIFHEIIRKKLLNIEGAINMHDDILIFGKNKLEHDVALESVLRMLEACGLSANPEKCEFFKTSIKFYGLIFNSQGVTPDPSKVDALKSAEAPVTKRELKSFLGMTNFSANFISNYSDKTAKLRELIKDNAKWNWTEEHERSFHILKNSLSKSCLIHYFDPKLETELICDASPIGVAAIVVQKDNEGHRRIIAYGSRALTITEQKYGQIEREALSILFGCLKFRIYLLGEKFTILTDHLPLIPCFNNPKSQQPYRIERIRMKLQGFDYVVKYIKGKSNISDYISRHLNTSTYKATREEREIEEHVHFIIDNSVDCVSIKEIQDHTSKDPTLSKIKEMLQNGEVMNKKDNSKFKMVYKELYIAKDLIMRHNKIVVPESLRHRIIDTGHEGHQGIVKTKAFLRSKYWWPAMGKQIENIVVNCRTCQASVLKNEKEPLRMTKLPNGPWESLATDFHGPLNSGEYLLVVIDEYSRYPIVEIVSSTSHKAALPKFDKIFSEFGIPIKVKSDNGPPFNGIEFHNFAKYMGFDHKPIQPEHPESNGLVEKFNVNLEKVIHTAKIESKNWRQELNKFLRNYRATPHSTTKEAPADLLFQKRKFKTRLPELPTVIDNQKLRDVDSARKDCIKMYADKRNNAKISDLSVGDEVLVKLKRKRKSDPYYNPNPYTIVKRKGNMVTARRFNHYITRNTSFFKKVPQSDDDMYDDIREHSNDQEDSETDEYNEEDCVLRRSTRIRRQPIRFPEDDLGNR